MGDTDRRRRSRSGRVLDALVWATPVGAASGAVLGDGVDAVGAGAGAVIGAALYAPAEQIFVYVADSELKTDHSFALAGQRFLTLHYEIERLRVAST
jgi:hypothetical protein